MSAVKAVFAFLNGLEAHHNRAAARLLGSPYRLRLVYLGGHPGIWESEPFWIGRVGDRLRLVDEHGQRWYDMEVGRILGLTCSKEGHLFVRYEPTPGLVTSVQFQVEGASGEEPYRKLMHLLSCSA